MFQRLVSHRRALTAIAFALEMGACAENPIGPTGTTLRVTTVVPANGSTTGATPITITGTGFVSGATVTVGGVAATDVVVQSATTLMAVAGTHAAGAVNVVVTSGATSATLTNGFSFVAPSGANQPPAIVSIRSVGSRANQPSGFGDLNETLTVMATVSDVETSTSALTYEWSGPGTFAAAAASTTWQLPASLSSTPVNQTATLKVTEAFSENGVSHRQSSTATFVVSVHDSQKEIFNMGVDFLTLWSDSTKTTDQVLHNFSTTCDGGQGRSGEANDTDSAHAQFVEDFSKFRISTRPPVTFNFGGRCVLPDARAQSRVDACSSYTVHWEFNLIPGGQRGVTDGTDYVSAVLENLQWKLCHSSFI